MIARLHGRWHRVRESTEWRLTLHFFRAMFDFGILSEAGADSFRHMMLGAVGGLIAFGFLVTRILVGRYQMLAAMPTAAPYRRALLGDDMLMIGLPMLLVAFVTLLVSQSLFPDERDFRILGPLPVARSTVFAAKLAGLLLFTGLVIVVAHASLVPWLLVSSANHWLDHSVLLRIIAWAVASGSASLFAVLAVAALVGVSRLTLSRAHLHALDALTRSGLFAALVLCIPLVYQVAAVTSFLLTGSPWLVVVPPAWFVGLQRTMVGSATPVLVRLAIMAVGSLVAVALVTVGVYLLLFRHFERLVLQPANRSSASNEATPAQTIPSGRARASNSSWAPPAFRAIAGFTMTTFVRSQLHQSVLVGLSVFGLGVAFNSILGASPGSLARAPYWTPFAFMFACGLAMRSSLVLPLEHRANWIFKMTEDEATRGDQFRAVDWLVTAWVAGVPAVWALLVWWLATGGPSPIAALVVALIGLVSVHAVLSDWRRIPFTCSYLPGKRFIFYSLTVGILAVGAFAAIGAGLVRGAQSSSTSAIVIVAVLSGAAWMLRRRRLRMWSRAPLMFEDEFPDQPLRLEL
ncbi:MAG TPA: hypothetical protein VGF24_24900 [Vicinamibacterales bacterium]|jgi:hypothetical protein